MIVVRKPITIYDVDLIGLGVCAALGAVAWFGVIAPWQGTWAQYRELATRRNTSQTDLIHGLVELESFENGLAEARQQVTDASADVPHEASVAVALRRITDLAQSANLQVVSVAPQAATRVGDYVVTEIHMVSRGSSRDFITFLDALALANPYQSLAQCSISRPPTSATETCEMAWLLRLYLLPDSLASSPQPAGVRS